MNETEKFLFTKLHATIWSPGLLAPTSRLMFLGYPIYLNRTTEEGPNAINLYITSSLKAPKIRNKNILSSLRPKSKHAFSR